MRLEQKKPLRRNKKLVRKACLRQKTPLRAGEGLKAKQRTARKRKEPYRSIFTEDLKSCYITGATEGVEVHHIFGAADKGMSEKYGFLLPLRSDWHRGEKYSIHEDRAFSIRMRMLCQDYYVNVLGKSEGEWRSEFRKWYTEEDMKMMTNNISWLMTTPSGDGNFK